MTDHNDNSFAQFQLPAALFTNLVRMGFNRPTPVQTQAIPFALEGRDDSTAASAQRRYP